MTATKVSKAQARFTPAPVQITASNQAPEVGEFIDGDGAEGLFSAEGAAVVRPDADLIDPDDGVSAEQLLRALVDTGAAQASGPQRGQRVIEMPLARRQLADKLKIPHAYFERMREEQPVLLDRNVNTWLQSDDDRRMIRTMDGNVRAVLSERYRRLDNFDLAESVLPILRQLPEVRFESVELTETRMYLKCVTPRLTHEMAPGDIVQAGVVISNSEVGQGTLSVQPLLYRLVCRNGLIAADRSLRKTHVGRSLGTEDEGLQVYQDDTLRADDKAFFLKVRDVVQAAVSEASFRQTAQKLQKTLRIPLTGDPVKTVEVLANRYALNDSERAGVLRLPSFCLIPGMGGAR